jgi:hypothetical protein
MNLEPEERRAYQNKRYYERKQKAQEYLGGKCVVCGTVQDLEFDHIVEAEKTFTISNRLDSAPWDCLVAELNKCQLLCHQHHLAKTSAFLAGKTVWNKGNLKRHGSYYGVYTLKCDCADCVAYKTNRLNKRRGFIAPIRETSRELVHGTYAGYLKEGRRGLPRCSECRKANNEHMKQLRKQASVTHSGLESSVSTG